MSADSRMMDWQASERAFLRMGRETDARWMLDAITDDEREAAHQYITDCKILRTIARLQMIDAGYLPQPRRGDR